MGNLGPNREGGITSFYMSGCRASHRTVHSTSRKCNVAIITGAGPKSPCRVKPAGPVIGPVNKVLPRPPLVAFSSLLATRTRVFEPIITYSVSIHSFAAGWSGLANMRPSHYLDSIKIASGPVGPRTKQVGLNGLQKHLGMTPGPWSQQGHRRGSYAI